MASTSPAFIEMVPTPNPEEVGFRVRLEATGLFPSQLPQVNTPFNKCLILPNKQRVTHQDLGTYLYTMMEKADSYLWFYFCKPKTEAEKYTPFRTNTSYGGHDWPPILKALKFIEDSSFPRATNVGGANGQTGIVTGPSYYVREYYVPGAQEGTLFKLEEFFAPTKFDIPQHEAPQPSSVSYDVPGRSGTFPKCLHKRMVIPNARTGTSKVVGDQSEDVAGGVYGQIFPATNFTEWEPYCISDKQTFQNGWYREKITVYPPDEPPTIPNN